MLLKFENGEITLPRNHTAYNMVVEKVNDIISRENMIFSHLTIDDIDIYENHENYILDRMNEIMKIEIVAKSVNEMIWETMESVNNYLERAIPELEKLSMDSFEGFKKGTWQGIKQLADGIQWMLQFGEFVRRSKKHPYNWDEIKRVFKECERLSPELLEAVETNDQVLITDLISYEIVPTFEGLKMQIEKSLENKEHPDNVN